MEGSCKPQVTWLGLDYPLGGAWGRGFVEQVGRG